MPNKQGVLSNEEFNAAKQWLEEHADIPCPVCGNIYWGVAQHVVDFSPNVPPFTSTVSYPAVLVVCPKCGYFRFHSIGTIGIPFEIRENSKEGVSDGQ